MTHKKPKASEKQVQASVLSYLSSHPAVAMAWRNNVGGVEKTYKGKKRFVQFGKKGHSDIIGFMNTGQFLAIEVKNSDGGTVSPEQQAFIDRVNDSGGRAGVACSVDDAMGIVER